MPQHKYFSVSLKPDTYFKVQVWADSRGCTMGEAVDFAFDNLGVPAEDEEEREEIGEG